MNANWCVLIEISMQIVRKWLYYLQLMMFIDKVKNFCDHSMILWEMAANRKPIGSFWTPPPPLGLTSIFALIFLSKHISLHSLGRLKWVLDIIWPLNQHFNLKNQRNWIKQVLMLSFLIGIICILLHWPKKLTLVCLKVNVKFFKSVTSIL